jgi:uncharacterized membrane protein YfhO
MKEAGKWAFIIGLIIAVIASFISGYAAIILLVLFILGLIVGFLNVSEKNNIKFLVAAISLLVLGVGSISALSILAVVSTYLNAILGNFIAFVSAAALVVAIKSILETGK